MKGRKLQGGSGGGGGLAEFGREKSGASVEGRGSPWRLLLSLGQQCGTTQGLVIVKSYQLSRGHEGIRG